MENSTGILFISEDYLNNLEEVPKIYDFLESEGIFFKNISLDDYSFAPYFCFEDDYVSDGSLYDSILVNGACGINNIKQYVNDMKLSETKSKQKTLV